MAVSMANDNIVIETAVGFGSRSFPFTAKWNRASGDLRFYYKEFAVRGTYIHTGWLSSSLTAGWLKDKAEFYSAITPDTVPIPAYVGIIAESRNVYYFIPSLRISSAIFRLDIGGLIFKSEPENEPYYVDNSDYPFNRKSGIRPSGGIELGPKEFYFVGRFYNSLPLYSGGGGFELGIGGRNKNGYEQKFYLSWTEHFYGYGYRGEVRIYRNTGLLFGLALGSYVRGYSGNPNEINMMLGIKNSM
jgi:hypothetical protein